MLPLTVLYTRRPPYIIPTMLIFITRARETLLFHDSAVSNSAFAMFFTCFYPLRYI